MTTYEGPRPRQLRIASSGVPGGTQVELDGQDIAHALTGLNLILGVDRTPKAVLDIAVHDLSTEAEVDVLIPDVTRALLMQMGWTPPQDGNQQERGDAQ